METTTTIKLETKTKKTFDIFQMSLALKLKTKITQDRAVNILLNTYKDFTRLNNHMNKEKNKK